jgi:hypothetical protein
MAKQVRPVTTEGAAGGADSFGGHTGLTATPDAGPFVSQVPGTPTYFPSYHGRAVSWVAVGLILAGFLCGGFALIFGPTWWAFWLGCGVAAVGGLLALATGIFEDWY